jgi:cobalt/nickel transport system permease protein
MRMHMANELLSVPMAIGTLGVASAALAAVCRAARRHITPERVPLMGILGAFIFAAQLVNFQLPLMPGTSGHLIGAVLLAIILGPHLGAIVISSVVILQCLIFQDGGLLALGCNIINMGLVPCYLGYGVYRVLAGTSARAWRMYFAAICACVVAVEAGAVLVPYEAAASGVLAVPLKTFLVTMAGVHLLVGLVEGIVTAAVLGYLQKVRPDIVADVLAGKARFSRKTVLAAFAVATVAIAAGLSLLASKLPDGLEWTLAKYGIGRPAEPAADNAGWTSFMAVAGSLMVMGAVYGTAVLLRKKQAPGIQ